MFSSFGISSLQYNEFADVPEEDIEITDNPEFIFLHNQIEKANGILGTYKGDLTKEKEGLAIIQCAADKEFAGKNGNYPNNMFNLGTWIAWVSNLSGNPMFTGILYSKINLSTSTSLISPSFQGDPVIFNIVIR